MSTEPTFVYRDGMTPDKEYVEWLKELKTRYRHSQTKAAVKVNTSMLEYYWSLGRDIIQLKAESKWGGGFFNQLSLDLREMFPNEKGLSSANLRYMKRWFEFYYQGILNMQRSGAGIISSSVEEILQRPVEELKMPEIFGQIPWGQHIDIISRCKSLDEALFYLRQVLDNGWSRPELNGQIDSDLYVRQGSAITNFSSTLPAPQSQLAQELLKDPYDFSFLTIKNKYDEHDLEEALVSNVTQFLLELGKGFSYVGRQMELQMPGGQTFFPDLVFYHIPQHRYVVVELKTVDFVPEFAGKLNFYVTAADNLLRGDEDNPSVGLLICKSTDKTIVEWSLHDIQKPLGVATYQLQEVVERTVAEIEAKKAKM